MKNFNFSLTLALYIFVVLRAFTATRDLTSAAVAALAASPLVWLALSFIGRGAPRFVPSRVVTAAPLSHFAALVCSVLTFSLVWKMRTGTYFGSAMQTFGNYRVGWSLELALQFFALSVVICAAALVIWTGYRFREDTSGRMARVFFAGAPEPVRLLLYIYIIAALWAIGVCALAVAHRTSGLSFDFIVMITARAAVPLMAIIIVALLRLRFMGVAVAVAVAAVFQLVSININAGAAAAHVGAALAAGAAFFAARFAIAGKSDPAPALSASPAESAPGDSQSQPPAAPPSSIESGDLEK